MGRLDLEILPPLVLLPGMDGTGDLFAPLLSDLGSENRATIVRYPTDDFLGYDALTKLVAAQLPLGEPFVLLAESFSGPVAIMLAARKPANLAGLILCASFARNPRSLLGAILCRIGFHCGIDLPPWAMRTALLNESAPSELSQLLLGAVSKVNSKVLQERLKAVLAVDVVQELDRIVVPSLYLRASDDRLVPKRAGDLIVRKRKNWQLKELAGPHLLLQAAPRQAARAIGRFIEGLSAG